MKHPPTAVGGITDFLRQSQLDPLTPFYESVGASPLKRNWYWWENIGLLLD
jgi:hypothetical protein